MQRILRCAFVVLMLALVATPASAGELKLTINNGLVTVIADGVPVSQILFGTDAPFFDGAPQVKGLQASGFSASELADVERNNALRLLGRAK